MADLGKEAAFSKAMAAFMAKFFMTDTECNMDDFINHFVRWASVCAKDGILAQMSLCPQFVRELDNKEEELDKFLLFCDAYPPLPARAVKPASKMKVLMQRLLSLSPQDSGDPATTREDVGAAVMHDLVYEVSA